MAGKKRVVRMKTPDKSVVDQQARTKSRSPEQLLELIEGSTPQEVGKALSESEVLILIDYGADLDDQRKNDEAIVKLLKAALMANAEKENWRSKLANHGAAASVSPSTSTVVGPTAMVKLLSVLGKQKLFDVLFSVKIGEVKKYLGVDVIQGIADVNTNKWGSMSFKRAKKLRK